MQEVTHHVVEGVHPAGNIGTQIHHIDPVNKGAFGFKNSQPVPIRFS
jgi:Na+-transporting NADH:ubiquinone oxidoreductase subunit NqrA